MSRGAATLALLWLLPHEPLALLAQGAKQVKVVFEFRQSGTQSQEAVQGSARPSGRLGVESTERTVARTTGIFTIVQDGGESTLLVASQVPYSQVTYYRDYLTGGGYVTSGAAFKDVGTSLKVRATVLPGNQVTVRLTPMISWLAGDRSGVIEVSQASTELTVVNRRPIVIGGATTQLNELTRRILGVAAIQSRSETLMTLTATVLE
jgi:hypothetical protein